MDEELIGQLMAENQAYKEEIQRLSASHNELCQTLNEVVKYMAQME